MKRLTKQQAAIIGAFTGKLCGTFSDLHEYIEKLLGRPVWTHELGNKELSSKIKEAAREDFMKLVNVEAEHE